MTQVLVVDPEASALHQAASFLADAGYTVQQSASARSALRMARLHPFDVAVVAHREPHALSLDFLARLRDIQPGCRVVMLCSATEQPLAWPVGVRVLQGWESEVVVAAVGEASQTMGQSPFGDELSMLDDCLHRRLLYLAVQPVVALNDATTVGYDALLRSRHPYLRQPQSVLRAACRHDMLNAVVGAITDDAQRWLTQLPGEAMLFLRLHAAQLADPWGLCETFSPLQRYADRVALEFKTDDKLLHDHGRCESLRLLKRMGFHLVMGDFGGVQHGALPLATLEPDYVKLGMDLIRGVDADDHKLEQVMKLCEFANDTETLVLAPGVETQREAMALTLYGVPLAEGFYFGAPTVAPWLSA